MNYYEGKKGWIEAIVGPMFAGKTEELIRRVEEWIMLIKIIWFLNQLLIIVILLQML